MNKIDKSKYDVFLEEIKTKISHSHSQALRAVNRGLIELYWDIGRSIVEKQKKYGWGKSIVENLGQDLQRSFPGTSGFSPPNLWRMRKFYISYQGNEKLAPLVRVLS